MDVGDAVPEVLREDRRRTVGRSFAGRESPLGGVYRLLCDVLRLGTGANWDQILQGPEPLI